MKFQAKLKIFTLFLFFVPDTNFAKETKPTPQAKKGMDLKCMNQCVDMLKQSIDPPSPSKPAIDLTSIIASMDNSSNKKLMIFGGKDNKTYLGCINCFASTHDSIWNKSGPHGGDYGDSIWSKYSDFGSDNGQYSPWCSSYSCDKAPIVVDSDGRSYGYFIIRESDQLSSIDQKSKSPEVKFIVDIILASRRGR